MGLIVVLVWFFLGLLFPSRRGVIIVACMLSYELLTGNHVWAWRFAWLLFGMLADRLSAAVDRPSSDCHPPVRPPDGLSSWFMHDGSTLRVMPFLKDTGPLIGIPARYFDRSWKRVDASGLFAEPVTARRRASGDGSVTYVVCHWTGLSARIIEGSPEEDRIIDLMRSKHAPASAPVFEYDPATGSSSLFVRACMIRYAGDLLALIVERIHCSAHPRLALLRYRRLGGMLRRVARTAGRYPMTDGNRMTIRDAVSSFDETIRLYGSRRPFEGLSDLSDRLHRLRTDR
ncbi:hypothetical protein [Bifidobacterium sp. SO1]|uniref:hypothetical protein n=1 Tax=Bifidobacterium sp. SO1 TaxID=2809029 RepID=UPI001BDDB4E9|nr:hypothetical protein [Bifidobacterium sp. SO1]MBT1161788.1 hypothetical protein [Bifidobacterium sp. SO1]